MTSSASRFSDYSIAIDGRLAELAEELATRLRNGESVDLDAFLADHPDQAEPLRPLLPAIRMMADLGHSTARALSGTTAPDLPVEALGQLGDYRILREIGRGGMGVVYEARQISLNRRVALKVLPFAAALDPRQLQRFHNEAQAAAGLHHAHIVPVYAIGCERGVHYYAMQFVEGRSLAEAIRDLRALRDREPIPESPTVPLSSGSSITDRGFFRLIARLGLQVAEALAYAHSLGVVHRDIKPANLLLESTGHLWIADFGLARIHAEAGLTMTGDIVGTLRYMSPEQALGRPTVIDGRTDVYSLGMTLYELLTLRPALDGRDRHALLRQIAFDEPPPPGRHNPAIPRELETIVLKAIAREPADRYATARELAADLSRFLEHRPIHARRPTLRDHAAKWARRHLALVAAGFVVLSLAVVSLTIGAALLARERAEADRQRARAEAGYRQALEAVDGMLTEVASKALVDVPQAEPVRKALLERAAAFYDQFLRERGNDPTLRLEAGRAYRRVGEINGLLGRFAEAEDAYQSSIALLNLLAREHPGNPEHQLELARSHYKRGNDLHSAGENEPAEREMLRALTLVDPLASRTSRSAEARQLTAQVRNNLGAILLTGDRLDEAESFFHDNVERLEAWSSGNPRDAELQYILGNSLNNLGLIQIVRNQFSAALPLLERAVRHGQAAVESAPDLAAATSYRRSLADDRENLALTLSHLGDRQRAIGELRQLVILRENLARDFPRVPRHRDGLAQSLANLALLIGGAGEHQEAEQLHRRALALFRDLRDEQPENDRFRRSLATGLNNLADFLAHCPEQRFRDPEQALALAREATELEPRDRVSWRSLGVASYRTGNWDDCIAAVERARKGQPNADAAELFYLVMAHWQLGNADQARDHLEQATRIQQSQPESDLLLRLSNEASTLLNPVEPSNDAPP